MAIVDNTVDDLQERISIVRRRHRVSICVFVAAILWFLPGIWWGLPIKNAVYEMEPWGTDELGPGGAVGAILALLRMGNNLSPQYPLAHYFVMAVFVWPYYAVVHLLHQRPSLEVMMLLHRVPSLLMAAGTVTISRVIGQRIAGNLAGWFTALMVATIGPALFYARSSNVDGAALFWTTLAMLVSLRPLREGLSTKTAVWVGLFAAIGTATKDPGYAFFAGLGLVLLATHLFIRHQRREWHGWWRGPATGVAVAAVSYIVLSGVLLLPHWFASHVHFIRGSEYLKMSQEARALVGFYYSNPATVAGYTKLASDVSSQITAAVGLPIIALALIGVVFAARSDRRILAFLIIPPLCLLLGVVAPVRFVLPRHLLPVDLVLCLFAGFSVGAATKVVLTTRRAVMLLAVAGVSLSAVRALDFTYQMVNDSRYEVGKWLERNSHAGDTLGVFAGSERELPRHLSSAVTVSADSLFASDSARPPSQMPMFLFIIPTQHNEPVHERWVTNAVFNGLMDGSLGYRQVLAAQTPAIWPHPRFVSAEVNPPIRVFARNDVAAQLVDPPRINIPDPR